MILVLLIQDVRVSLSFSLGWSMSTEKSILKMEKSYLSVNIIQKFPSLLFEYNLEFVWRVSFFLLKFSSKVMGKVE